MKKILVLLMISLCTSVSADDSSKIKVKEIREHLRSMNPDTTCMDEYIKRRSQLILKLSLSPVTIVAGTMASTYVGGTTAVAMAGSAANDGWAALGYAIFGGAVGGLAGVTVTGIDTTSTAVNLRNLNLILKTLGEQHLGREGIKSAALYTKYVKKSGKAIGQEEFLAKLLEADANGTLCDGSMVHRPMIRLGSKLKYKVAKLKDIAKHL